MNLVIGDLLHDSVACYLDDLLLFDRSEEEALKTIEKVLQRFLAQGLKFNPSKCSIGQKEVKFLGYDISESGWKPFFDKVKAIHEFPKPETVKQVRQFNGMVNFFHSAVPKLQVLMAPLYKLISGKDLTRNQKVEWNPEANIAFRDVKQALAEMTLNSFFSHDPEDRLYLSTDSSLNGFGCVLSQYQRKTNEKYLCHIYQERILAHS